MVDETLPPPAAPGPPDRRRPGPTIELEATEIASRPVTGASSGADNGPAAASEPAEDAGAQASSAEAPGSRSGGAMRWSILGGAALGVGATLAGGAVALWAVGSNDTAPLEARVAQLEQRVGALAAKMPTDTASASAVSELAGRVGKLEALGTRTPPPASAQPGASPSDPALEKRVTALEGALKSVGERLDSAAASEGAAIDELAQKLARAGASGSQSNEAAGAAADATTATMADLTARLDALEAGTKALAAQERQQDRQSETPDDHTLRAAIIASSLASLVERGRPFAAELKAAQAQEADTSALAPLERFAAGGVPNQVILVRELTELLPALQRAAGHPDGGFLDKLQANAERLVRIRPIEQTPGDDPPAILSRVEFKAVHNDVPGALAELGSLPENVRAPAQGWIDKAQARVAAVAASRAFAAAALAALGKPSR